MSVLLTMHSLVSAKYISSLYKMLSGIVRVPGGRFQAKYVFREGKLFL
jgi:hypothetical protein